MIGNADEFWRVRVTKVDASEELDFEWHDDILWREPRVQMPGEYDVHLVEAVSLASPETVVRLGAFGSANDAADFAEELEEELRELTRSQFEAAYFPESDAEGAPPAS